MNISRKPPLAAQLQFQTELALLRLGGFDDRFLMQWQLFDWLSPEELRIDCFSQPRGKLSHQGGNELLLVFSASEFETIVTKVEQFIEKSEKNSCQIMQGIKSVAKLGIMDVEKGNHLTTLRQVLTCFSREEVKIELCSTTDSLSTLLFDSNELARIQRALNQSFILSDYYAKFVRAFDSG